MKLTACLVGSLVGDGWMKLPGLCRLSQENELSVVAGTYALPIWEWGKKYLADAAYEVVEIIEDPDSEKHPFCPGFGYPAMDAALKHVKALRPNETVIGCDQIPTCYNKPTPVFNLREPFDQGDWVAIQPYTRHSWKNCRDIVRRITYPLHVKVLGFPGEVPVLPGGWEDCTRLSFDEQVAIVAGCRFFVGIGSSWSNVATLFHKAMIHVSYTEDLAQFTNPKMVKMVEPTLEELQEQVNHFGRPCGG